MRKRFAALLLCGPLLTACPIWNPPPPYTSYLFNFSLPAPVNDANARIAAIAFLYEPGKAEASLKNVGYGYLDPVGQKADLSIPGYDLDALAKDPKCFGPFKGGQDTQDLDLATVTVKPENVNTCQVFFLLYTDANHDNLPQNEEIVYDTHDQFVYADQDFTYSGQSKTHIATEQGTRTRGWTLVRHVVLQPAATPGHYQVTMNSEQAPQTNGYNTAYQLRLHEPSEFFSSMSVGGRK